MESHRNFAADRPADRQQVWPKDGLEHLGACPVCDSSLRLVKHYGLTDLSFECAAGQWTLWQCDLCRSAYLDPRPAHTHIGLAYARYYTHGADQAELPPRNPAIGWLRTAIGNAYVNVRFGSALRPALPGGALLLGLMPRQRLALDYRYRHIRKLPPYGGKLLDIGCGNGDFLVRAQRLGWQGHGLEPDPAAVNAARGAGLDVLQGGIEQLAGQSEAFDQISLCHVIEHVHDPLTLLAACYRLLRPGGMLSIEAPNPNSHGSDRFGAAWRGFETPRHLVLLSHPALHDALLRCGFARSEDLPAVDPSDTMASESVAMAARADPPLPLPEVPVDETASSDPLRREFLTVGAWKK